MSVFRFELVGPKSELKPALDSAFFVEKTKGKSVNIPILCIMGFLNEVTRIRANPLVSRKTQQIYRIFLTRFITIFAHQNRLSVVVEIQPGIKMIKLLV